MTKGSKAVNVKGRRAIILLATIPLIVSYAVFTIFPMGYAFVMSFTNWNPGAMNVPTRFIGLRNYEKILFENDLFWVCLLNTIYYTLLSVPIQLMLAVILATMINSIGHFKSFFRTMYYLPVLTTSVAVVIVWKWLYQPRYGLFNSILALIVSVTELSVKMPRYLSDPVLAMPSIVAMDIWHGIGYTIVICLAGLQGIPQALYEAAKVDGANRLQLFRHVTVPLLRPTILFVALTGVIGSLQVFVQMFLMTKGGPVNATRTVVYLLFSEAFRNSRFGYASAMSFLLFVVIMGLTLLQRRFFRTEWSY